MNATKPIAVIAATLISFAGISAVINYSNAAAVATRTDMRAARAPIITTLPAIEVVPSPEELRETARPAQGGSASAAAPAPMPYYSFAADQASA